MKLEFSRQIFEKSNIKFHENPSSGSRVVPCGRTAKRTDRLNEAHSRFSKFCERVKKPIATGDILPGISKFSYLINNCELKHEQQRNYVNEIKRFFLQYDNNLIFMGHCNMYTLFSQMPNDPKIYTP